MKTEFILLHISLIEHVALASVHRLLGHADVNIHDIYDMKVHDVMQYGFTPKSAQALVEGLTNKTLLEKELELIEKHNIKIITVLDDAYPSMLKHIEVPPLVLYYKGASFFNFEKNIAVIGSRKANHYAQQVIASWLPTLIEKDWSIVSGGALGADAMAHEATLNAQGRTVAVLGSGLLNLYPRSNIRLFDNIVDAGGALVSSFPLTMEAYAHNFPARNRIISGLSSACLIVQAAKKSGASITAAFALEQGRMVFVVPGSVFDPLHEGCHALIKDGATVVGSIDDLMLELGEADSEQKPTEAQAIIPCEQHNVVQEYTAVDQQIMGYCRNGLVSMDELIQRMNMPLDDLYDLLFNLQLAGKIEQNAAGLWQAR